MILIRLEGDDGLGVYRTSEDICLGCCEKNQPSPFEDNALRFGLEQIIGVTSEQSYSKFHSGVQNYNFAFKDIEQMMNWFPRVLYAKIFMKSNIKAKLYDVSDKFVVSSHYQCVFKKSESRLIGELKIQEIYGELKC